MAYTEIESLAEITARVTDTSHQGPQGSVSRRNTPQLTSQMVDGDPDQELSDAPAIPINDIETVKTLVDTLMAEIAELRANIAEKAETAEGPAPVPYDPDQYKRPE